MSKPPWVKFKDYLEGKGPFEKPSGLQTITENINNSLEELVKVVW